MQRAVDTLIRPYVAPTATKRATRGPGLAVPAANDSDTPEFDDSHEVN